MRFAAKRADEQYGEENQRDDRAQQGAQTAKRYRESERGMEHDHRNEHSVGKGEKRQGIGDAQVGRGACGVQALERDARKRPEHDEAHREAQHERDHLYFKRRDGKYQAEDVAQSVSANKYARARGFRQPHERKAQHDIAQDAGDPAQRGGRNCKGRVRPECACIQQQRHDGDHHDGRDDGAARGEELRSILADEREGKRHYRTAQGCHILRLRGEGVRERVDRRVNEPSGGERESQCEREHDVAAAKHFVQALRT